VERKSNYNFKLEKPLEKFWFLTFLYLLSRIFDYFTTEISLSIGLKEHAENWLFYSISDRNVFWTLQFLILFMLFFFFYIAYRFFRKRDDRYNFKIIPIIGIWLFLIMSWGAPIHNFILLSSLFIFGFIPPFDFAFLISLLGFVYIVFSIIVDLDRKIKFKKFILSSTFDMRVGLATMIIGLFMVIIGFSYELNTFLETGKYFVPVGIGLYAVGLALDSTDKMRSIANVQFLQVVNILEDARAFFIGGIYKPDLFGWKTENIVEMAVELLKRDEKKKYIDPEYQDKLLHYFNISLKHLFKFPNWNNETDAINRFVKSYAMLEEYYNDKRKKEFIDAIEKNFGKDKDGFFLQVKEAKKKLTEKQ